MTKAICAICGASVARDKSGRLVLHTRFGPMKSTYVDKPTPTAIICEGSRG